MVLMVTTDHVPGREIQATYGLVRASTVRARHIGSDIGAGLKSIVGGKIGGYEKLMKQAREECLRDLEAAVMAKGGDAVVGLRMQTSDIMQGASEIVAYGTAVKLR